MVKASDNLYPKVILEERLTDGSDTTTPAADHRSLFLGEDGNLHLKDSAAAVTDVGSSFLGARVYHNAIQAVAHNTDTELAFNSERFDVGGFHDTATNNGRLTIPTGGDGKYLIGGSVALPAGGADHHLQIKLGGTTGLAVQVMAQGSAFGYTTINTVYDLVATNYVSLWCFHTQGGSLNIAASNAYECEFWITKL